MEGGVHPDPFKSVYSIKCLRNAPDLCMRSANIVASVKSSKGSCECCELQSFLRVYASSKESCECCEQQRFLRELRAAKVLASVASSKGSCECMRAAKVLASCEQQRVL